MDKKKNYIHWNFCWKSELNESFLILGKLCRESTVAVSIQFLVISTRCNSVAVLPYSDGSDSMDCCSFRKSSNSRGWFSDFSFFLYSIPLFWVFFGFCIDCNWVLVFACRNGSGSILCSSFRRSTDCPGFFSGFIVFFFLFSFPVFWIFLTMKAFWWCRFLALVCLIFRTSIWMRNVIKVL